MRVALLTPEHVGNSPSHGGLASYAHNLESAFSEAGHDLVIFSLSAEATDSAIEENVVYLRSRLANGVRFFARKVLGSLGVSSQLTETIARIFESWAFLRVLKRTNRKSPFDVVQFSDYRFVGLFLRSRQYGYRLARCSQARDLYDRHDGRWGFASRCDFFLERLALGNADQIYAPSAFVAEHYKKILMRTVHVVRPPLPHFLTERKPAFPDAKDSRFLLHFGQLIPRKGTDTVAKALTIAWQTAPDLRMIWVGKAYFPDLLQGWLDSFGDLRHNVTVLLPQPREHIYELISRAEAAVLPSKVDNLPNTVIEALSLGIPVLGTRNSSVDELVEEGLTGHLVEVGDAEALAEKMLMIWTAQSTVTRGFKWTGNVRDAMDPRRACENLLALVPEGREDA